SSVRDVGNAVKNKAEKAKSSIEESRKDAVEDVSYVTILDNRTTPVETGIPAISADIDRTITPVDTVMPATPASASFYPGDVAPMEAYVDTGYIQSPMSTTADFDAPKLAEDDLVESEEEMRRRESDIDAENRRIIDRSTPL
ncbi:hypothetical protein H6S82_15145, partial [Planktothrix sp. FACHB-1355]